MGQRESLRRDKKFALKQKINRFKNCNILVDPTVSGTRSCTVAINTTGSVEHNPTPQPPFAK